MNSKQILENINKAVKLHNLNKVQTGDLTTILSDYNTILNEVKPLSEEDFDKLLKEVCMERPFIGKKLKDQLNKDK